VRGIALKDCHWRVITCSLTVRIQELNYLLGLILLIRQF